VNIQGVFLLSFFGSLLVNLLHFHGDGSFCYTVKPLRIPVAAVALILCVLSLIKLIPLDYAYSLIFGWMAFEQVYSIWRRHRERAARHAKPSAAAQGNQF
jgi:hypothetical protein